jgi:alkylation response protein AidB-like acyl-CoA dehydrogenase
VTHVADGAVTDAFRSEVADWFAAHNPVGWRDAVRAMSTEEWLDFNRTWLRTLNTRGYGAPHVPREWGGGGYSLHQQVTILSEWARVDAPGTDLFEISLFHVPGTLLAAGTDEQRQRYVRQGIDGVIWCQGFSEPGAGSDLASLRTRAVADGDGWRVHGQKIWSSHADHARYCLLLARTNPDASRHHGITYFICDLDQPGVEVRPITQTTGLQGFCEIFFDGAHVGPDGVIGGVDDGWAVAQSTLETERGVLGLDVVERMGHHLHRTVQALASRDEEHRSGELTADEAALARLLARHHAVRALCGHAVDRLEQGDHSGGLASLMKVSFSELLQELADWETTRRGEAALVQRPPMHFCGYVTDEPALDWLHSWGWTIAGGANEIQRNIIGERLLGLPRQPRPR